MISAGILQTLKYSDHFGFPLTLSELHLRLVSSDPCSLERVIGTLQPMLHKKLISQTGDYYHLPGRSSLVARRLKRAKLATPQLARAKYLSSLLSPLPSILSIFLTGSLAMRNSNPNSDIDLMIIAKPGRLWTTRLFLTLYTSLLGLRRTPNSTHNTGKLCLNLYLTPTTYDLPSTKQSLYTAYELLQAIPLYDPQDTRSSLLAANPWIKKYLPNFPLPNSAGPGLAGLNNLPARPGPIGIIEKLAYWFQKAYMKKKITRELITPDSAFFHPHNPAPKL